MRAYFLLQPGEKKGYIRHSLDVLWWKESYYQPRQHIKKQRHYFANKGPSVKAMVFPVVMHGCESCTVKKAEC